MEEQIRTGIYDLRTPPSGLAPILMGSGLAGRLRGGGEPRQRSQNHWA